MGKSKTYLTVTALVLVATVVLALNSSSVTDWISAALSEDVDTGAGPKLAVDERNGTVEGVGLGDRGALIERVFGEAPPHNIYKPITPIGVNAGDLTNPPEGGGKCESGRETAHRYRGVSFFGKGGMVCGGVIVTSERAKLRRGIGPGDPIERVEELYPELECGETAVGENERPEPACWGQVKPGTYLWIGGDPINNVIMAADPIRPSVPD